MELDVDSIYDLSGKDKIAFKKHTVVRMQQRKISANEIKTALQCCKIIDKYPDDRPLPSGLVLGYANKRPIHPGGFVG